MTFLRTSQTSQQVTQPSGTTITTVGPTAVPIVVAPAVAFERFLSCHTTNLLWTMLDPDYVYWDVYLYGVYYDTTYTYRNYTYLIEITTSEEVTFLPALPGTSVSVSAEAWRVPIFGERVLLPTVSTTGTTKRKIADGPATGVVRYFVTTFAEYYFSQPTVRTANLDTIGHTYVVWRSEDNGSTFTQLDRNGVYSAANVNFIYGLFFTQLRQGESLWISLAEPAATTEPVVSGYAVDVPDYLVP